MNLIDKIWIKYKNKNIKFIKTNSGIKIINDTNSHGFIVCPFILPSEKFKTIKLHFSGDLIKGNGAVLQILDFNKNILSETSFNSNSIYHHTSNKKFLFSIKIHMKSEININKLELEKLNNEITEFDHLINSPNDILIITPSYPTEENKYFGGFVHSRVKAYKKAGIKFDLVCAHRYPNTCTYNFEGIDVTRTTFKGLRDILTVKKYKKILLHFFDIDYAKILDACDVSNTQLYFWIHGPETLYWDWSKMTDMYFQPESPLSTELVNYFKSNDSLINRYNNYNNVHWIFVSNWIKRRSEELIKIKFKNYSIIPNFIDDKTFNYTLKSPELRNKIFFIRRFENINKYAIDINVRTILELSRRDCFKDLEFNIYGNGQNYDALIAPIKNFKNVHLYPQFLTHSDIAKIHKENGIGLFATRYDAQGVSMCEAAMSGLVIVSSENDAIAEFIPSDAGLLCKTEDYVEYADTIERIYKSSAVFSDLSKKCHDKVYNKCRYSETIQKEINLIRSSPSISNTFEYKNENKLLSIIIPSYNVGTYLTHGINTILSHKNANKIQVIVVNDGSCDNTLSVAKLLQEKFSNKNVTIIDKPNGGHGSTINAGLKEAVGKYVRIIDGDDWVNSDDLSKLIDILEKESSDIVVTNYCEDWAETNDLIPRKLYDFMIPGKQYLFDDLCYEHYGFREWGPILATSNLKTEMLKKHMHSLTEKCFYIDMEFDAYSIAYANTISFYPLDIYRYFIGRADQSISKSSYSKHFKQHEQVLFNLLNFYTNSNISDNKKNYILNKLIIPMVSAHYTILIEFLKSPKEFRAFENKFKKYAIAYYNPIITTKMKKFHRKTHGIFIKQNNLIKKIGNKILHL